MGPGEHLLAFLDDTYILSEPEQARHLHNVMANTLETRVGIQLHAGKTRIWNWAGPTSEQQRLGRGGLGP